MTYFTSSLIIRGAPQLEEICPLVVAPLPWVTNKSRVCTCVY